MECQKWTITFSNPGWLGEGHQVVCEATNEELIDMTAQSYEFREMLDENEVVGSLVSFWEGWCDMNEEEDYRVSSLEVLPSPRFPARKKPPQGNDPTVGRSNHL